MNQQTTNGEAGGGLPDPYEAYFDWCKANGFRDVAECEPKDLNVTRFDESISTYGKAQNAEVSDGGHKTL